MNETVRTIAIPEMPGIPASGQDTEGGILYLADSGRICRELIRQGLPAVGYLHAGNRAEDFTGVMYLVEEPEQVDDDSWVKMYQRLTGQPWTIAVTDRLWIREMTRADLDALYVLYDDPQARAFLDPLSTDRAAEAKMLQAYIEKVYGLYGYGIWAVCDIKSGELIGRVGFAPYEGDGQAQELGYLIRADRRGRGLAQEAVTAALRFAKESLGMTRAGAHTAADNAPSIALLRKMGFEKVDGSACGNIIYFGKTL